MGVATFTQRAEFPIGNSARLCVGTLAMSASYATNGDTVDFQGDLAVPEGGVQLGGVPAGIALEWDGTNQKVKAYRNKNPADAGGADIAFPEVANAVNLSTSVCECWVILST